MRRQADASFRKIEPELLTHRPIEPWIALRFRRPHALDQAAEHHAVDRLQPRFEQAVDAHRSARGRAPSAPRRRRESSDNHVAQPQVAPLSTIT
jgi:hypothetical protein